MVPKIHTNDLDISLILLMQQLYLTNLRPTCSNIFQRLHIMVCLIYQVTSSIDKMTHVQFYFMTLYKQILRLVLKIHQSSIAPSLSGTTM